MSDSVRLTDTQRSAAISRAGENLALRSGAGCGKTFVLARRFTELLMKRGADENPLSRFVALTFTEKAAVEMTERVRRLLTDLIAASRGADDRAKLRGWLEELPEARISTIHGFCAALLRTHAIEAGVDPNFAVAADELVTGQMRSEAADQAVLAAVEQGRPDAAAAVVSAGYDPLVKLVGEMLNTRTAWSADDYADAESILERWRATLGQLRRQALERLSRDDGLRGAIGELAAMQCTSADDKLLPLRDRLVELARDIVVGDTLGPPDAFAEAAGISPGNAGSNKAWDTPGGAKAVRHLIKDVQTRLAEYSLFAEDLGGPDRQAAEHLAAVAHLAVDAERLYAAEKRQAGLLDFDDLLVRAERLLRERPRLREAVGGEIDQLLMDEAQDTDRFQLAMLELLLFGQAGLTDPPEGRLFLVGDDKQSIYRFRGAEVEAFEDLCRRLGVGRREDLDLSFRTHRAGVQFVNDLFARLMGAAYTPIRAHRREAPPGPSVEILLADGIDGEPVDTAAAATTAQAAATAERVRQMLDDGERIVWDDGAGQWRPVRAGDVAILFSRMTNSQAYERELTRRGVEHYVVAGTGFFQQQEVFDVLNALRTIDNPFDDIAFFGVLRSALFGLDDNALMQIAERIDPPYLPAMTADPGLAAGMLEGADGEALQFAVELLGRLHRCKDAIGADELIQRLVDDAGYETALLSQFSGRRMLGNVRRLIDHARSAAAGGQLDLAGFIAQMDQHTIEQSRYEQAAVAGEAEDVVRLMTIHKAKGLEFPVVILPDLNRGRRPPRGPLIHRPDVGWTCKVRIEPGEEDESADTDTGTDPLMYRIARRLEDADQQTEDIRKLYVAATRHEDHLVCVGANYRTNDGVLRDGDNYIRRIDEALGVTAAMESGAGTIPYGEDGQYQALVRAISPSRARSARRRANRQRPIPAEAESGERLAESILASADADATPPPLLGPLDAETARAELAVTALVDFAECPMLYRWRYELRVSGDASGGGKPVGDRLDPLTLGTFYHRCVELLDFDCPQPAEVLARQASTEMGLDETGDVTRLSEELRVMLDRFADTPLAEQLRTATCLWRELHFMMDVAPATVRGQIDLLYEGAGGELQIVDYKSDRVEPGQAGDKADRYRLQMLLYAAAAAGHFGRCPAGATLYFLRTGETHTFETSSEALADAREEVAALARSLTSARRSGRFDRVDSTRCAFCPYTSLCRRPPDR